MSDIYEDIQWFMGLDVVFTHQLAGMVSLMLPHLRVRIEDPRFWEEKYDETHIGEMTLEKFDDIERKDIIEKFNNIL